MNGGLIHICQSEMNVTQQKAQYTSEKWNDRYYDKSTCVKFLTMHARLLPYRTNVKSLYMKENNNWNSKQLEKTKQ